MALKRKKTVTVVVDAELRDELKVLARKLRVGTIGAAIALLARDHQLSEELRGN